MKIEKIPLLLTLTFVLLASCTKNDFSCWQCMRHATTVIYSKDSV